MLPKGVGVDVGVVATIGATVVEGCWCWCCCYYWCYYCRRVLVLVLLLLLVLLLPKGVGVGVVTTIGATVAEGCWCCCYPKELTLVLEGACMLHSYNQQSRDTRK